MALALHQNRVVWETGGSMSLDGQVMVIAFFAMSLKLFLWATESNEAHTNRVDARSVGPQDLVSRAQGSKRNK